jgi:hypothetical protein
MAYSLVMAGVNASPSPGDACVAFAVQAALISIGLLCLGPGFLTVTFKTPLAISAGRRHLPP